MITATEMVLIKQGIVEVLNNSVIKQEELEKVREVFHQLINEIIDNTTLMITDSSID